MTIVILLLLSGMARSLCAQEDVVARLGLVRQGPRWLLLPQEVELRQKLAELPRLRERIVTAQAELEAAVQANLRAWQESRPALDLLKQSLARLPTGDPQRLVIERQMAPLAAASVDPTRLAAKPQIARRLADFSEERCELLAATARIRQIVPTLPEAYAKVAAEPKIAALLTSTGGKQRLGPQRSYTAELDRLREFEELAATRWVPVFLQSGQTRLTALLNEHAPATFTWSESTDQPLVLTAATAEAVGMETEESAAQETIDAAPGRTTAGRRVKIGHLRLGACLLQDVDGYILPPEAEDIGNRLGRQALIDHRVRLEPQQLRMWIDADQ